MRTLLKSFAVAALLILYSLFSLVLTLLPTGGAGRRRLLTGNASLFARLLLSVLGIRVIVRHQGHHHAPDRTSLIVANHLSYVDILVIAAIRPSAFITSVELKRTFPLGMFAWFGGSIFVERRNPTGLKKEIKDIAQALTGGSSVVLFPEGTTFDGVTVRPFKNSLFTAAIMTATPVLPVCIRYRRINGKRVNELNRDSVYYYGSVTFREHAPRLLALRSLHVECIKLDPLETGDEQSRKDLAARCHAVISAAYHARPSAPR